MMSEYERIEHQKIEEAVQAARAEGRTEVLEAVVRILTGEEYGTIIPAEIVSEILGALQRLFPEFQMPAAVAGRRI